ncbi:amidohydrolase family protein [Altericroceibacterium endophyticum]|uniref:Amidohydrolase family protein n=1 Tax=Altericroceibacterium endophyticum TaxID=1808508 RepID=A0A6I4T8H6_9SPHN|nr:amidohydrolase family protein [Altericroceibacterium endophyticum]MXO67097.1 amidohydrolase family protein [Altericroceibacterium endophyticum]
MINRRHFIGTGMAAAGIAALPASAFAHVIKPSFKLFDTHAHFYTNDVDKYPFNSRTARYGPEIMVAKAMRFPQTPKEVFAFWDEVGIAKGAGVQYSSTYRFDNSYLLDIAAEYPNRIVPVVILDPVDAETPATLERMASENRIAGVRFTGVPSDGEFVFLSDAAAPAWEAANRLGLVIVLMPIGGDTAQAMAQVAKHADKYPNVNIVLDHIGFPRPADLPETWGLTPQHLALADHDNVYYKYTTLLIEQLHEAGVEEKPFLEFMVKTFGADHMVWGSDVGNTPGSMFGWVQYALASAEGLSLADRKALFWDTAERTHVPGGRGRA